MEKFKTAQEQFWATQFGDEYIERNPAEDLMGGRITLFSKIMSRTRSVSSVMEFGSNIGNNIKAINTLSPAVELSAIELNEKAAGELREWGKVKVYNQSILDFSPDYQRDLVFTSGVLIHLDPQCLPQVYDLLHSTSRRYISIIEYYNPTPVEVDYRGHSGKLFKRDFAGELLDKFENLRLVDYGFAYHRDNNFRLGDLTWFLLEKK